MADIKLSDIFGGVGGMSDQVILNKNDIIQLKKDVGERVKKSGDTMTGALNLNASTKQITFANSNNYISKSSANLYIAANDTNGRVILEGKLNPLTRVGGTDYELYHWGNLQPRLPVADVRGVATKPSDYTDRSFGSWFNNTGLPTSSWYSGITVKGWSTGYSVWELFSHSSTGSHDNKLYFRGGINDTWNPTYEVYHTGRKPSPSDLGAYTKAEVDNLFTKKAGDTFTGQLRFSSAPAATGNTAHIFHDGNGVNGTPINIRSMRESSNGTVVWEKISSGVLRYSTGNTGADTDKIIMDVSNGHIDIQGEFRGRAANNFRHITGDYGVFGRINGSTYYILATNKGDQLGTYSGLRPFAFNLSNGIVTLGNGATSTYLNTTGTGNAQGFSFNGKTAIGGTNDSWLRLNPTSQFADGVYCGGTGTLRHDGSIQRGSWGAQGSNIIRAPTDTGWGSTGSAAFSCINTNTSNAHWLLGSYIDGTTMRSGIQILSTDAGTMRFWTNKLANYVYFDGGNVVAQNNVTAFSDVRVKANIKTIENALEKTLSMRGVTYDRTDQNNVRQTGLIAQEVESVVPEAVITVPHDDYDDFKSVAYGNLVGLLVESIRELNNKIERLESLIKE